MPQKVLYTPQVKLRVGKEFLKKKVHFGASSMKVVIKMRIVKLIMIVGQIIPTDGKRVKEELIGVYPEKRLVMICTNKLLKIGGLPTQNNKKRGNYYPFNPL